MSFAEARIRCFDGTFSAVFNQTELIEKGVTDKENSEIVSRLFTCWLHLLADSPLALGKPRRAYRQFYNLLLTKRVQDTVNEFCDLFDILSKSAKNSSNGFITEFHSVFLRTPIAKEYIEWHKSHDPKLYQFMSSFLLCGKKLDYEDESFNTTAFREWLEIEEHLRSFVLPDDVKVVQKIVAFLLPSMQPGPVLPKFGPGYTSEGKFRDHISKLKNLKYDSKIDWAFFRDHVFTGKASIGLRADQLIPSMDWKDPKVGKSKKRARLKFVRKNLRKSRSICMEPNVTMYFQQAFRLDLENVMHNGPMRHTTTLKSQSRNQILAEIGSVTGRIDTLDQSAASDCVHVDLVRAVFPKQYLYYLLATRTSEVETPDGNLVRLEKFAPMGSALCFPVQCVIFTALCYLAALYHAIDPDTVLRLTDDELTPLLKGINRDFSSLPTYHSTGLMPLSIYGDDICVDNKLTPYVTSLLTKYGFFANSSKSFMSNDAFRESCGKHYLDGVDVTPYYFKLPKELKGANAYAAAVSQANYTGDLGLKTVRSYLIRFAREVPGYDGVVFTSERGNTSAIFSTRNTLNSHLKHRDYESALVQIARHQPNWKVPDSWLHYHLQRDEVRGLFAEVGSIDDPAPCEVQLVEQYLFIQWQRVASRDQDDSFTMEMLRGVPSDIRYKWRWTPLV